MNVDKLNVASDDPDNWDRELDVFKIILEQRKFVAEFTRHATTLSAAAIFGVIALLSKDRTVWEAARFAEATVLFCAATVIGFFITASLSLARVLSQPSKSAQILFSIFFGMQAAMLVVGLIEVASVGFTRLVK